MKLYQAVKGFKRTLMIGGLATILAGCINEPTLEQNGDLTGDGTPDAIVKIKGGINRGTYLFIGQEDGSFIRAKRRDSEKYFKTDDGETYFFDGKAYSLSPKKD